MPIFLLLGFGGEDTRALTSAEDGRCLEGLHHLESWFLSLHCKKVKISQVCEVLRKQLNHDLVPQARKFSSTEIQLYSVEMCEVLPLSARLCDTCGNHSSQTIRHVPFQELPTPRSLHNPITQLGGLYSSLSGVRGLEENLILRREVTTSPMPQKRRWEKGPHICEKASRTGGDVSKREKWGYFTRRECWSWLLNGDQEFSRYKFKMDQPQTAQHGRVPNTENGCFSFLQS